MVSKLTVLNENDDHLSSGNIVAITVGPYKNEKQAITEPQ